MHGVQGNALNWIQSFLIGRSQTVVLEGESSNEVPVSPGVPHDSVWSYCIPTYIYCILMIQSQVRPDHKRFI